MVTKTAMLILTTLGLWFAPIYGALIFICILVFVDTMTGVYAAFKHDVVTSNKAFQLVPKLLFYGLLAICGQGLAYYVEPDIPWVKIALAGIAWIEIKSIDENFKKIFGFSFISKINQAIKQVKNFEKRNEKDIEQ